MIKAECKETETKNISMKVEVNGEGNLVLNEYKEITRKLIENFSSILGEDEAKKIVKKAYKLGLKEAIEKEGK